MSQTIDISFSLDLSGFTQGMQQIKREISSLNRDIQTSLRDSTQAILGLAEAQRDVQREVVSTTGQFNFFSQALRTIPLTILTDASKAFVRTGKEASGAVTATKGFSGALGALKGGLPLLGVMAIASAFDAVVNTIGDIRAGMSHLNDTVGGGWTEQLGFAVAGLLTDLPLVGGFFSNFQEGMARSALEVEIFGERIGYTGLSIEKHNAQMETSFGSLEEAMRHSLTTDRVQAFADAMGISFDEALASLEDAYGAIDLLTNDFAYMIAENGERFSQEAVQSWTTEKIKEFAEELGTTFEDARDRLENEFGEINLVFNDFVGGLQEVFSEENNRDIFSMMTRYGLEYEEVRKKLAKEQVKIMMNSDEFTANFGEAWKNNEIIIKDANGEIITNIADARDRMQEIYLKMVNDNGELTKAFKNGDLLEFITQYNGDFVDSFGLTREELLKAYGAMSGEFLTFVGDMTDEELYAKFGKTGDQIVYPFVNAEGELVSQDGAFNSISRGLTSLAQDFINSNIDKNAEVTSKETTKQIGQMYQGLREHAKKMGFEVDELGNVIGPNGPISNIRDTVNSTLQESGKLEQGMSVDFEKINRSMTSNLDEANRNSGISLDGIGNFFRGLGSNALESARSMGSGLLGIFNRDFGNINSSVGNYTGQTYQLIKDSTDGIEEQYSNSFGINIPNILNGAFTKAKGIHSMVTGGLDKITDVILYNFDDELAKPFINFPRLAIEGMTSSSRYNLNAIGETIKDRIIDSLDGLADRLATTIRNEIRRAEQLVSADVARLRNITPNGARMMDTALSGLVGLATSTFDASSWTPDSLAMAYAPVGLFSAHSQAMDDVFRNQSNRNTVIEEGMEILISEVQSLRAENNQLKVYLDSGQLVGGIVNELDTEFQRNANYLKRGITPPYRR